jgi:hypothetical protein
MEELNNSESEIYKKYIRKTKQIYNRTLKKN